MNKGYLAEWTRRKIGLPEGEPLTREALRAYQLTRIRSTLAAAKAGSVFYKELYAKIDPEKDLGFLSDVSKIPFIWPEDLRAHGDEMICVNPGQISRIVTLDTSGTTGLPKRIYFTEEDQELTTDYFHLGLHNMADEKDCVLILLPCRRQGSVGDLFRIAAERMGMKTVPYGVLGVNGQAPGNKAGKGLIPEEDELKQVLALADEKGVTFILGLPSQVSMLAGYFQKRLGQAAGKEEAGLREIKERLRAVLLSAEYVSEKDRGEIAEAWQCEIYEHYGMTEMGLGGAVSCRLREGYHLREEDLYFEIVDPATGNVLPEGEYGEIVFSTLTRTGMPLLRYRTGDMSRFLPEPCACGSILRRLERVGERQTK